MRSRLSTCLTAVLVCGSASVLADSDLVGQGGSFERDLSETKKDYYQFEVVFKEESEDPNDQGLECMSQTIGVNIAPIAIDYVKRNVKGPYSVFWNVENIKYDGPRILSLQRKIEKIKRDIARLRAHYDKLKVEVDKTYNGIETRSAEKKKAYADQFEREKNKIIKQMADEKNEVRLEQLKQRMAKVELKAEQKQADVEAKRQKRLNHLKVKEKKIEMLSQNIQKKEITNQELLEQLDIAREEEDSRWHEQPLVEGKSANELLNEYKLIGKEMNGQNDQKGGKPHGGRSLQESNANWINQGASSGHDRHLFLRRRFRARFRALVECSHCRPDDFDFARRLRQGETTSDNVHETTPFLEWMGKGMERALRKDCDVAKKELASVKFSYADVDDGGD